MNASCQQENGKFETDCFQILSPDIIQLCNIMLLVDWLQVNVFFIVRTHQRMTIAADISFVTFSHHVGGGKFLRNTIHSVLTKFSNCKIAI